MKFDLFPRRKRSRAARGSHAWPPLLAIQALEPRVLLDASVAQTAAQSGDAAAPFISTADNLAPNGSFETGSVGAGDIGWQQGGLGVETDAEVAPASFFGVPPLDGARVVEVEGEPDSRFIYRTVDGLVPGQTYTLSWYARTRLSDNGGSGEDRGEAIVSNLDDGSAALSFTTSRTGWQPYSLSFTAPADGSVQISFNSLGSTEDDSQAARRDGTGLVIDGVRLEAAAYVTGYIENGAVAIASPDSVLRDLDSAEQASLRVHIVNGQAGDVLSASGLPAGISASYDAASRTLTLSGNASTADYLAALRQVQYSSASEAPSTETRTIEVVANDGSSNSNIATTRVAITAVNDAPVLDNSPSLSYTAQEDAPAPPNGSAVGEPVSNFTGAISDPDAASARGIAITGNAPSNGVWWYTTDGGANWQQVGTVSDGNALLLADDAQTRLYFQATTADYNGSGGAHALSFRAWDQSSGSAGGRAAATANGGATAFSTATETVAVRIAAVNDAPAWSELDRTLNAVYEDNNGNAPFGPPRGAVGQAVAGSALYAEYVTENPYEGSSLRGIAIVGANTGQGSFWYSIDNGTTWTRLAEVSESNALLLAASSTTRVYFQPAADYNGNIADLLTIRAWDRTQGSEGRYFDIAASGTGGTTAFSSTTDTVRQTVFAISDIQADGGIVTPEDTAVTVDVLANDSFEGAGRRITAIDGMAISAGGPAVAVANGAVRLEANGTLRFTPARDYAGNAGFSYTVSSGGVEETANVAVNVQAVADAPRIDLDANGNGSDYSANYDQGSAAIGRMVSVTDPENNNLAALTVAITSGFVAGADTLRLASAASGISASYDAANGVLRLTGNGSLASYQQALANVRFETTSGTGGPRTLSVQATSSVAPTASNTAIATLTPIDSDRDGRANAGDIDDDNDGILDIHEGAFGPSQGQEQLVSNPDFRSQSGWTSNSGWEYTGNALELEGNILNPNTTPSYIEQTIATTPGQTYFMTVSMYMRGSNTNPNATNVSESVALLAEGVQIGTLTSSTPYASSASMPPDSVTVQFVATGTQTIIRVQSLPSSANHSFRQPGDGWGEYLQSVSVRPAELQDRDSDGDGVVDRTDIDADDDGIPDNVEAQATASYRAPSGQGAAMVDADRDGLDDAYDRATADATAAASVGLTPVDTDGDGLPDPRDPDSDNDGRPDIAERGDGQPASVTSSSDGDGDGLLDIFEHGTPGDGYNVHDGSVITSGSGLATSVRAIHLADGDLDTAADGRNAQPPARDFDWRDRVAAPVIDLNSAVGGSDDMRDHGAELTGGGPAVNVAAAAADVSDLGENDIVRLTIGVAGVADGGAEIVNMGGTDFALNTDAMQTVSVGGVEFQVGYTVAAGFVVTRAGGGVMPQSALDALVRGITYRHQQIAATAGARMLSFTLSDTGGAASAAAVSTLRVMSGNLPPVVVNESRNGDEDQSVTGNVLANDADPEGGPLVVAAFTVAGDSSSYAPGRTANIDGVGTIAIAADGNFVFTPVPDYDGRVPAIGYTVRDDAGQRVDGMLNIGIRPVQDAPMPRDPGDVPGQSFNPNTGSYAAATQEDTAFNGQVAASDADGDTLTYSVSTPATQGSVAIDADTGAYTYTPAADAHGTDSFVVTVSDGRGGTMRSTVNVTVTPIADIASDSATTNEDTPADIAVFGNDTFEDPGRTISAVNGSPVTAGAPLAVSNGTVTLQPDGTLRFVPATDFNGATSFSYTVDAGGTRETAEVRVDVASADDTPVPRNPDQPPPGQLFDPATGNYTASTREDTAFRGQVAGSDGDGDRLDYTVSRPPAHGTVALDAATGAYTYTPAPDYNGPDSFVVAIGDGHGHSAQSTVELTVRPVADIAVDQVRTDEDTPVDIDVLANDGFEDPARRVTAVDGTAVAAGTPVAVANGMVTLQPDGSLRFVPASNYSGSTEFRYAVASGGVRETARVGVHVAEINDPPQPVDPGDTPGQRFDAQSGGYAATTAEDTPFNGQVAATDADGQALSYRVSSPPAHGTVTLDAATGAYTYTPAADYHGADRFVVAISDGSFTVESNVAMTVTPVADIAADSATTNEDTPVEIAVFGNDSFEDPDRAITAINGSSITPGVPVAVPDGTVTLQPDGSLRFVSAADFNGATRFSYTVGAGGESETAEVDVAVAAVNDPPKPRAPIPPIPGQTFNPNTGDYAATTQEDTAFNGQVAASDADGDALSYGLSTPPAHGSVTIDADTGAYTYTPAADYEGGDSFVVSFGDGQGGTTRSTVELSVAPVADIAADSATTSEDTPVDVAVLGNDSFEDPGRRVSEINGMAVATGTPVAVSNGTVTLQPDGTLRFVPAANFDGVTRFGYSVDAGGVRETAEVRVEVAAVNDPPVPRTPIPPTPGQTFDPDTGDYAATTQEDAAFSGQVAASDADGDVLTYSVSTPPAHGSVTIDASTGAYTYTPAPDYHGADGFVVTASDGRGGMARSRVDISVTPVADIAADSATTNEDTPVDIAVFGNDTFEDPARTIAAINGSPVTAGVPVVVPNGTVTLQPDGALRFAPTANFHGVTRFNYTVDAGGTRETAEVAVDVRMANDPPATGDDTATTQEDTAFDGQVSARDADGDARRYNVGTPPAHGSLTVDAATGAYTYTPAADFNGADSFVVTVSDGRGGSVQSRVEISVTPVADIADDVATTNEDTPVDIAVLGNDTFEDARRSVSAINGTAVAVGMPMAVANGSVTLRPDGTLHFVPAANFNGATSFSYTVDAGGTMETADVAVNVVSINDPPVLRDPNTGAAVTREDTPFDGQVTASDDDGDALSYSVGTPPAHGSVTIDASTGAYTYTPAPDFNGADSFVVTVGDGQGGTAQRMVTLNVMPVADIAADTAATSEGTPVAIAVLGNDSFENPGRAITAIDGSPVPEGTSAAVANGTVTLQPDGTLRFVPAAGFNGTTRFSYTVAAGGTTETAEVRIDVSAAAPEPAAPAPAPPASPDPVFVPPPAAEAAPAPAPRAPAKAALRLEPVLLAAVDGAQSLHGTTPLAARGAVLQAANGLGSLDGTVALDAQGAVLRAVEGVASLHGLDAGGDERREFAWRPTPWVPHADPAPPQALAHSLRTADGLRLEFEQEERRAWLSAFAAEGVRELRVTLADGRPVPAWLQVDAGGFVNIDRPADVERLRLRITLVDARGVTRSEVIEIDFATGQLRRLAEPAPSFSQQLERAVHPDAALEAALLELPG